MEGEDEKYYKPRVEAISGRKSVFIDCKGRDGVVQAIHNDDGDIDEYLSKISKDKYRFYIRGKYELDFLTTYLKLKIPQINNEYRKKVSQSLEEPLSLFSPYAETSLNLQGHMVKNMDRILQKTEKGK